MGNEPKSCKNCKHFSALANECRKEAPTPFIVMSPQGPQCVASWPAINPDNGWCSEFVPDLVR